MSDTLCRISNVIIKEPDSYGSKTYVKLLACLQISTTDLVTLKELERLCNQMTRLVRDRLVSKVIFHSDRKSHKIKMDEFCF